MLDRKSEELEETAESLKKMQRGIEKTRLQLKEEYKEFQV
jgi:hypothetical protein